MPLYFRQATQFCAIALSIGLFWNSSAPADQGLRVATFAVDASPAVGSPLAYDPTREITEPLSCRGVVLLGAGDPVVLCAVDWIGIGNESNTVFRRRLASAVGTFPERVVVHTLHQHDAPRCDLGAARLLAEAGYDKQHYDVPFIESVFDSAAAAARNSLSSAWTIDAVAIGEAPVDQVASNRRLLDAQGKVVATRYTACRDENIRSLPVGVVDPQMRVVTLYHADTPVARLSFFATHPQSYYRTGGANPDFPGMARNAHQQQSGVFQVHFNGAGGNVGAGKFNDGSPAMRAVLAERMRRGMAAAVAAEIRRPLDSRQLKWNHEKVALPVADHLDETQLRQQITAPETDHALRVHAADQLAFLLQVKQGHKIQISCLDMGEASILFMPGELFVEYQLAAAHMKPERNVLMAAYGDYGPFYIGTRVAYPQGGYETSPRASNVSPAVEEVLLTSMRKLLQASDSRVHASDFTDTIGPGLPAAAKASN